MFTARFSPSLDTPRCGRAPQVRHASLPLLIHAFATLCSGQDVFVDLKLTLANPEDIKSMSNTGVVCYVC